MNKSHIHWFSIIFVLLHSKFCSFSFIHCSFIPLFMYLLCNVYILTNRYHKFNLVSKLEAVVCFFFSQIKLLAHRKTFDIE